MTPTPPPKAEEYSPFDNVAGDFFAGGEAALVKMMERCKQIFLLSSLKKNDLLLL